MNRNLLIKTLVAGIVVLFIANTLVPNINANVLKDSKPEEITKDRFHLNNINDNVHLICFVESGYVEHKNVNCTGFYISAPFNFCIGSVELDLKGFHSASEEPRLTIKSFSGKIIYENNISVSLKGFIGRVCPTGSLYSGFLKGFAMITRVTNI